MYHQFNFKKFYVISVEYSSVCVFLRISEQRAIISLYEVNELVFITEKKCVYCEARTEPLNVIQANLRL